MNWEYHYYLKAQIHEARERFQRERRLKEENRREVIEFTLRFLVLITLIGAVILFPVFFPAHRDIGYGGLRFLLWNLSITGVFFFFGVGGVMPLLFGGLDEKKRNSLIRLGIGIACYISAYLLY